MLFTILIDCAYGVLALSLSLALSPFHAIWITVLYVCLSFSGLVDDQSSLKYVHVNT